MERIIVEENLEYSLSRLLFVYFQHTLYYVCLWSSTWYIMVANPACGQLNRENRFFPVCPRSRLSVLSSRELGLTVPSRVSPFILRTQAESGAY